MNKERKLQQVHFQITRNCNLRCAFCGQWGKKGFFSDALGEEMTLEEWKKIVVQLKNDMPKITLWGGEPLVSPFFDELLSFIKKEGFKTEIITNGVLIDKHKAIIENCVDKIYISLDGIKDVHDEIRGKGVYDKVINNIREINHKNIVIMSVITPKLIESLNEFLKELDTLNIRALYLQDMIGLTGEEVSDYKAWIKDVFDVDAVYIDSWQNDNLYRAENIKFNKHSFSIEHKKHTSNGFCKSPLCHAHITWNGNLMYCTDFYDFSAGNVKKENLFDILENDLTKTFRKEISKNTCTTCRHCSWRELTEYSGVL